MASEKKEDAEKMYVRLSASCADIARDLGVSESTVYRWKAEAAEKGELADWDSQRRTYNMSPGEMVALYAESVKAWLVQIKNDPDKLADPKIADALAKHVSVMQKLDTRSQYLGVALDLIKVANDWLTEHKPDIKKSMDPHWESIYQALVQYSSRKGIL